MASRNKNRQLIIDALPGTQSQIVKKLGLGKTVVSRWLIDICKAGEAHVYKKTAIPTGNAQKYYKAGKSKKPLQYVPVKVKPLVKIEKRKFKPDPLNALFGGI